MKKGMLSNIIVFLKGMAMGIADIIPGVSGGTIAIITGIYEEFLSTLNNINLKIIKLLFKGKFKFLWEKYNLSFLSSLILGILTSVNSI
jgi:Predicted membrane protein